MLTSEDIYICSLRTNDVSVHETWKGSRAPGRQSTDVPLRIIQCLQFGDRAWCVCCCLPELLRTKFFDFFVARSAATSKGQDASRARSARRLSRRAFCVFWNTFDADVSLLSSTEGSGNPAGQINLLVVVVVCVFGGGGGGGDGHLRQAGFE